MLSLRAVVGSVFGGLCKWQHRSCTVEENGLTDGKQDNCDYGCQRIMEKSVYTACHMLGTRCWTAKDCDWMLCGFFGFGVEINGIGDV